MPTNYYKSKNNVLYVHRGDTVSIVFPLRQNCFEEKYIMQENDKVYFSITEPNQPFLCGVVRKILTKDNCDENNDVVVNITVSDTENLEVGVYYYELKLEKYIDDNSKEVQTVVSKKKLYILD